jgi:hypothetical protein
MLCTGTDRDGDFRLCGTRTPPGTIEDESQMKQRDWVISTSLARVLRTPYKFRHLIVLQINNPSNPVKTFLLPGPIIDGDEVSVGGWGAEGLRGGLGEDGEGKEIRTRSGGRWVDRRGR